MREGDERQGSGSGTQLLFTKRCSLDHSLPHLEAGAGVAAQLEAGAAAQQGVADAIGREEGRWANSRSRPVRPLLLVQLAISCTQEGRKRTRGSR